MIVLVLQTTACCVTTWQCIPLQQHVMLSLAQPMFSQQQVALNRRSDTSAQAKGKNGYPGNDYRQTHD